MTKKKYVMLGHSHIFGDLIEIIHANNGILVKIVQNVPEILQQGRPSLRQRIKRLQNISFNKNNVNQMYPIIVQNLEDFQPQKDEKYIIGFTGFKMIGLIKHLTQKFRIQFTPLIHPNAVIAPNTYLSPGLIIQAGAIISSDVELQEHVFINKGVNVGCNVKIEKFACLAPGTIVGNNTLIGKGVTLGIASIILNRLIIHAEGVTERLKSMLYKVYGSNAFKVK